MTVLGLRPLAALAALVALTSCQSRVIEHADAGEDVGAGDAGSDLPPPFFDCRQPRMNTSAEVQMQIHCSHLETDIDGACDACLCSPPCSTDADCGPAPGGTATPRCEAPYCVLECDGGKACPDGMVCVDDGEQGFGHVCTWPYDEPLTCYLERHVGEDPCAAITSEAECRAMVSEVLPGLRCDWITRRIFGDAASSCTPVVEQTACVATVSAEYQRALCEEDAACGVGDRAVYYRDLGGGDTELIEVTDCTFRPELPDLSACDFSGTAPVPLVCGCGCTDDAPASTPAGACACPAVETGGGTD